MQLNCQLKGHECPLVVIRDTAPQVRVAAILVPETCSAWLSADRSPHHRHRFVSLRALGFSLHTHCWSAEQGTGEVSVTAPEMRVHLFPYLSCTTNFFFAGHLWLKNNMRQTLEAGLRNSTSGCLPTSMKYFSAAYSTWSLKSKNNWWVHWKIFTLFVLVPRIDISKHLYLQQPKF